MTPRSIAYLASLRERRRQQDDELTSDNTSAFTVARAWRDAYDLFIEELEQELPEIETEAASGVEAWEQNFGSAA